MKRDRAYIVVGGGGHAKVLLNVLKIVGAPVLGVVDRNPELVGQQVLGFSVIGTDDEISKHNAKRVYLVNAIGSIDRTSVRREIFMRFAKLGYEFPPVIHPSVVCAPDVVVSAGAQLMAGVNIQPGSSIGENTIVNTGACVDHDCKIGSHVHIAPRTVLSGGVTIGDGTHIGTGAVIKQGVTVGPNCLLGAAALLLVDIAEGTKAYGVPAKIITKGSL